MQVPMLNETINNESPFFDNNTNYICNDWDDVHNDCNDWDYCDLSSSSKEEEKDAGPHILIAQRVYDALGQKLPKAYTPINRRIKRALEDKCNDIAWNNYYATHKSILMDTTIQLYPSHIEFLCNLLQLPEEETQLYLIDNYKHTIELITSLNDLNFVELTLTQIKKIRNTAATIIHNRNIYPLWFAEYEYIYNQKLLDFSSNELQDVGIIISTLKKKLSKLKFEKKAIIYDMATAADYVVRYKMENDDEEEEESQYSQEDKKGELLQYSEDEEDEESSQFFDDEEESSQFFDDEEESSQFFDDEEEDEEEESSQYSEEETTPK